MRLQGGYGEGAAISCTNPSAVMSAGFPSPASWKWLAVTAVVMFAYYALLVRSYGVGDMSVVYPLARGLAPVLTTIAAFLVIGEALSTGQIAAVVMISIGIMALSFGAGASHAAVGFALATGVSVATYSFFAGLGGGMKHDQERLERAGHHRQGSGSAPCLDENVL